MARFDVYLGASGRGYLLDCQSDVLDALETRVVVPLLPVAGVPRATRLNPVFAVDGRSVVMSTNLIFSIPEQRLGKRIGQLSEEADAIMNALDMLFTGF